MIVIPTGYMNSGSSAITDLLSEFEGYSNIAKSQEFIFMHCPHGVLELEKTLLNPISHLICEDGIKNFKDMMLKLYDLDGWWPSYYKKYISENFMDYVDEYIIELTDHKFNGFWYMDEIPVKRTLYTRVKDKLNKTKKINQMHLSYPSEEKFYSASKKFINKIIKELNKDNKENIIIDQLLLPYNIEALNLYFEDAKLIIVERDPRDVFILNKKNYSSVPFPMDPLEFAKVYKNIRRLAGNKENENVLRIKFEDLVYNYETALSTIYNFLKIDSKIHINKKTKFNPDISINNTQLFRNYENQEEMEIIERELKEYLYDFPFVYEKSEREVF